LKKKLFERQQLRQSRVEDAELFDCSSAPDELFGCSETPSAQSKAWVVPAADDLPTAGVTDGASSDPSVEEQATKRQRTMGSIPDLPASLGSLSHSDRCTDGQPNLSVPDVEGTPQLTRRAMQALEGQRHWETFEHADLQHRRIDEQGRYLAQCRRCGRELKQNKHDFNNFLNHLKHGCKYPAVGIRSGPSRGQITRMFARSLAHLLACS
jgi:hypothetical protein